MLPHSRGKDYMRVWTPVGGDGRAILFCLPTGSMACSLPAAIKLWRVFPPGVLGVEGGDRIWKEKTFSNTNINHNALKIISFCLLLDLKVFGGGIIFFIRNLASCLAHNIPSIQICAWIDRLGFGYTGINNKIYMVCLNLSRDFLCTCLQHAISLS